MQEHLGTTPSNGVPTMGHVHLRVGDLEKARAFYADTLGFAITAETQGALFFAAGGHHHHVTASTWSSAGASDRPDLLGLGGLTVHLGDDAALSAAAGRLTDAGATFAEDAGVLTVDDPWSNTVRLLAN
jgi:catechol 2,3-dioxygenase